MKKYGYKAKDVIGEYLYKVLKEWDLSLPEREEDETDDQYEETCFDSRHDVEEDIACIVKERLIKDGRLDETDESYDELIGEMVWNELSQLSKYAGA